MFWNPDSFAMLMVFDFVFMTSQDLKIVQTVVCFVFVFVVNLLLVRQVPSNLHCHQVPSVTCDSPVFAAVVKNNILPAVFAFLQITTAPVSRVRCGQFVSHARIIHDLLCQLSYGGLAPRGGIEPPTNWLTANCTTAVLSRKNFGGFDGGGGRIRTYLTFGQRIYSPPQQHHRCRTPAGGDQ